MLRRPRVVIGFDIFRRFRKIAKGDCQRRYVWLSALKNLGSRWTDFYEIRYVSFLRKSVEKNQVLLKSDKNNGYFT